MSRLEELRKQLEDSQKGMVEPMSKMMKVFHETSGKAAAQFCKAFKDQTVWQHKRNEELNRQSEGIGGAWAAGYDNRSLAEIQKVARFLASLA